MITSIAFQYKRVYGVVGSFLLMLCVLSYSQGQSIPGNKLIWLNLDKYPTSLPIENDFNSSNSNAEYHNGWGNFYAELANQIEFSRDYVDVKFDSELAFTVTSDGELSQIMVSPENSTNARIIIESVNKLEGWKPAYRNGKAISQDFKLKISNKLELYTIVEKPAMPKGGYSAFYDYIGDAVLAIPELFTDGKSLKTYLQFVVLKDGSINDVKLLKKLGQELDAKLAQIVLNASDWYPAVHRGENVLQRMVMPLNLVQASDLISEKSAESFNLTDVPDSVDLAQQMGLELPMLGIYPAQYPGGPEKQDDFIERNRMPISDKIPINKSNNQVILEFTVDLVGNIRDITIVKSLGSPFDVEAIRLYRSMPLWLPRIENEIFKDSRVRGAVLFGDVNKQRASLAMWHHDRGIEHFKKENYDKALDSFSKAIERNPYHLSYYYNRATTYLRTDQKKLACSDLAKIKSIDEDAGILYTRYCY